MKKIKWSILILFPVSLMIVSAGPGNYKKKNKEKTKAKEYVVAAYYFPDYHVDSINERWHGQGWTEWNLVKDARPRFKGHEQPKVPLWGYFNEADPKWTDKEINLAADNGIDVFIYV